MANLPANASSIPDDRAYEAAMSFIYGRLNYERVSHDSYGVEDFKLARMARFLDLLGSPHEQLPVIHVAGTKGKGSTSAMLAAMLEAAGLTVGLFTSPHLTRFEERLAVNRAEPTHAEMASLVETVKPAVDQLTSEMPPGPTFFEMATALAWIHFLKRRCDVAVLEVGLGGRLDSTNLCRPLFSIITSISRDHMRLLGETLPEIAAEKAGIIKAGVPVATGVEAPDVLSVIESFANRNQAPLYRLTREIELRDIRSGSAEEQLPCFTADVVTPWKRHAKLRAPLPGRHQLQNLALAVTVFDGLSSSWKPLAESAIKNGLNLLEWPLRIEQVAKHPRLIVDTAHNDASMAALIDTLSPLEHARRVLVFATSRDKDAAAMLGILSAGFDEVILTRYLHNPRALPLDQLESIAKDSLSIPYSIVDTPVAALGRARSAAGSDGLICVTGSLFLAAEMRELVKGPAA